jgi:phosphatidylserine/phosphatidylglycerophosphate/cardiolipin synthase-like enzyme
MRNKWNIDSALRVKRFEATEKAKKVVSVETMIRDLEDMAAALSHRIEAAHQGERASVPQLLDYRSLCSDTPNELDGLFDGSEGGAPSGRT